MTDLQDIRLIQEDTGNYLRIGCAVINPNATLVKEQFCKMTDPQGTEYQITPTAATERITAVTLDLNNYVCSIEIKKPLLESEKGRWSCSIAGVGGMIMVDKVEGIFSYVTNVTLRNLEIFLQSYIIQKG